MQKRPLRAAARHLCLAGLGLAVGIGVMAGSAAAKEYLIGFMNDRSGPIQNVGLGLGDGLHDYLAIFNDQKRMPGGHTIAAMEIDHGYNVPRGIEAYERFRRDGVMTVALFGTPHTVALTPRLTEDQILGTSPGFGSAASANGDRFPFLFPAAASYWSQIATALKYIMDDWKESRPPKIAFLYYDNPAGREPFPILDDLEQQLKMELRRFAVPPPGIEMRPQVLDIARRFRADWVIAHVFGRAPGVALKEFTRVGFPRGRMIGSVWAGGEPDIRVNGWEQSAGYLTIQMAHVGSEHVVHQEIRDLYKRRGRQVPERMTSDNVYYNRGVSWAALHSEAIRRAVEMHGQDATTVHVKEAMESINGYSERDFMPPFKFTPQDHEGGGFVKIYAVAGEGFTAVSGWIQGYRDVVMKHVMEGS